MNKCKFKTINIDRDHIGNIYNIQCEYCNIKLSIRQENIGRKCDNQDERIEVVKRKNTTPLPNPGIPDPYADKSAMQDKQEENSTQKITEPTFLEKVVTYAKSTAKHIATGAKLRSQEEIDAIMDICRACPFFNVGEQKKETAVSGKCGKGCGCNLNTNKSHITNKIARVEEHCPLDHW